MNEWSEHTLWRVLPFARKDKVTVMIAKCSSKDFITELLYDSAGIENVPV